MSTPPAGQRLSPELHATFYHFAALSTNGVASAYFGVWLAQRGMSPGDIGIISAGPVLALLVFNLVVGRIADRAADWRQVIIVLSLIAGLIPFGFYIVGGLIGFTAVWTLNQVPVGSMMPVLDAATLRMTERRGTSFSAIRAWGSIGYMIATAATGLIVAWLGPTAFLPTFIGWSLLRAVLSLQLPQFRAPERQAVPAAAAAATGGATRAGHMRELMTPWFILPIVAFALVQATHQIINSFAALLWKQQGVPEGDIGWLIAASTAAEIVVMFTWPCIGRRFPARQMILASAAATVIRWTIAAFGPPVPVLFLIQLLHSITFAIGYLGTMQFVANWTSEDIAAEAQSSSYVVQQAISVVVLVGFGPLAGAFGYHAFAASAVLGGLGVICVLVSIRLRPLKA